MKQASALFLLFSLAGCMAPAYLKPNAGPTAELTVSRAEGSTAAKLFVHLHDSPDCKGRGALEPIDFDSDASRVTTIVANRPMHLMLKEYNKQTGTTCRVAIDFDPVEGGRYRATWSTAGNQCFVRLEKIATIAGIERPTTERSVRTNRNGC